MDIPPTVQGRLAWVIDLAGLDDREVARLAGLPSEAHVGMIRRGTIAAPKGPTLQAIATALGVSAGWLAFGEGDAPDPATVRRRATDTLPPASDEPSPVVGQVA